MDFSPRDFDLMGVIHVFTLQDHIQLVLKNQRVPIKIKKAVSKSVCGELKSKLTTLPTAQSRYNELFKDAHLEWKENESTVCLLE